MMAFQIQATRSTSIRLVQKILVWIIAVFLMIFSIGRSFGTDIENYQHYFSNWSTDEAAYSLEPIYLTSASLLQAFGFRPTVVIELIAIASLTLITIFATKQRAPLAAFIILLSWLLLQQIWGTIRMGLGVCILLFANEIHIRKGRTPYWTFLPAMFHWSLLLNPFFMFIRLSARMAALFSVGTYLAVVSTGSIRHLFFNIVPPQMEAIANYAELQGVDMVTTPSATPLAIHLCLIHALTKVCSPQELPRLLGPLTFLYCMTCLFFDFDQAAGRVANILISMKLLALIRIYDGADLLSQHPSLVRGLILTYCILVSTQYYGVNSEFF